jgi:rare lipoprotein A
VTFRWRALGVGALALLAGCAGSPRRAGHASLPPPPPGTVPDAVPRAEPRASHGNPPFYEVNGERYVVRASAENYVERGVASWYGPDFQGHSTSSGERYDMYAMTAAHKTLPIPCYARITNLVNGRSIVVRINDRGPFVDNRIVDLSYAAATRLDIVRPGTAFVELRTVGPAESAGVATPVIVAAPPTAPPAIVAAAATAPPATPAVTSGATAPAVASTVGTIVAAPASAPGQQATPETSEAPEQAMTAEQAAVALPPASVPAALYIQVGAFADAGNAQRVVERLQAAGVAHVFSIAHADSGPLLRRVRVGPIATVEEFDRLAAQLATLGYPEARLAND